MGLVVIVVCVVMVEVGVLVCRQCVRAGCVWVTLCVFVSLVRCLLVARASRWGSAGFRGTAHDEGMPHAGELVAVELEVVLVGSAS